MLLSNLLCTAVSCHAQFSASSQVSAVYCMDVLTMVFVHTAGNVVQTLVMSSMVPLTIFAFTLSLPYLPPAPPLGPNFWVGTVVLVVGLLTFNSPQWRPALQKKLQNKTA